MPLRLSTGWMWLLLAVGLCPLRLAAEPTPPRLVVVIVVDQMRQDYLTRFQDLFLPAENGGRPGGFGYLLARGAVYTQCAYDHHPTQTAVGHSTLVTGAWPAAHGIVANTWYDPVAGQSVYAAADPEARLVGAEGKGPAASPKHLACGTLADELKLQSLGKSLVYAVALKDRAAVLGGGATADLALWFDADSGRWVSSTYYVNDLPDWVQRLNGAGWARRQFGWVWKPLLPDRLSGRCRPSPSPGANPDHLGLGAGFPHPVTGGKPGPGPRFFQALALSPLGIQFTFEVAQALLENEPLGQDAVPDLLLVSLSSNDMIGHTFGPYSAEVLDATVRTDRELSGFLAAVDQRVGLAHVVVALCSDHGVAPLPEEARELGLPALRVDEKVLVSRVEAALARRFGPARGTVASFAPPHLYLGRKLLEDYEEACEIAARAAAGTPGVFAAYTGKSLMAGEHRGDPVALAASRSYYPGRSGDVVVVPGPFCLFGSGRSTGTSHGTPWTYDTHVPLILAGPGVPQGRFPTPCSPRDLAPTLCDLLGINPPTSSSGRVLFEQAWKR